MEVFEKIISKINEKIEHYDSRHKILTDAGMFSDADRIADRMSELDFAREIVKQTAAEYNNGWILCSERLPDYYCSLEVTLSNGSRSVCRYTGMWKTLVSMKPVDVIAWKEPTEPYHPHICTNNDCTFNDGKNCPAAEGCAGYERKRTNFDVCCESMEAMAQIIDIAKIGWTKGQIKEWLKKEECEVPE